MGPSRPLAPTAFARLAPRAGLDRATPEPTPEARSLLESFLWRVGFLSIITSVVVIRMDSDGLVGQVFGLVGAICCMLAYRRRSRTPQGVGSAPRDGTERAIRMGDLR